MVSARFDRLGTTDGRSMEFTEPTSVIAAYDLVEVVDVLNEAEAAARSGQWAVGYVAYDATPALNVSLPVRPVEAGEQFDELPLAWFALFPGFAEAPSFVGEARLDSSPYTVSPWIPTQTEEQYHDSVRRIRRLITSGDLTQVNYALRLDAAGSGDPKELYRDLFLAQRGEWGAYLDLGRYRVLSASPEGFFKVEGSRIRIQPMKGSVGRGRWVEEDRRSAEQLRTSERYRDEHMRSVEQMRRELATISAPGSVVSEASLDLRQFETVWQLVSKVTAELDKSVQIIDVFRALFPSAAVTGDPKHRAMETIATLEGRSRGIYGGAVGFFAPSDGRRPDASFNVAIRTLVVDMEEGIGEYGVGAGITATSPLRGEFHEALEKARILTQRRPAIALFERIRWEPDHGFRWLDRHLERLSGSARYFGFQHDESSVRDALENAIIGRMDACSIRLDLDRFGHISTNVRDEQLPPATWWPNDGGEPVTCELSPEPIASGSVYRFHKTTARRPYEDRLENQAGVDEVLMMNERGEITEGTRNNVAIRIAGAWLTPPLASGCMPGVFRSVLIDEGVLVEEVVLAEDLAVADAIAVLNSVSGWRPARLIHE